MQIVAAWSLHEIFSEVAYCSCKTGVQVRTRNFEPSLDLGAYGGLGLRVKGDGLRYKCTVRTDTNWDGIGYTL